MVRLIGKKHISVASLLKEKGFFCMVASPDDNDADGFIQVMINTGRSDLEFKPLVPVCYEKQLSRITSFIVEGYVYKKVYVYDFYKARFYKSNQATDIRIYGNHLKSDQLIREINRFVH
jgi:hypothetical protein